MATPDNSSLIVANSVSNNLMFVDPESGQVQRWVENIEDPYQIGFSPDRKWLRYNRAAPRPPRYLSLRRPEEPDDARVASAARGHAEP